MITTMLHWLIKELIKGILQMLLLLLISWLHFLASCLSEVLPNPNNIEQFGVQNFEVKFAKIGYIVKLYFGYDLKSGNM